MEELHTNFKIIRCGLFINEEYPQLHATADFLCSCDCGEVKCPFCIESCDFDNYVKKSSSWLEKDSSGNFYLKTQHHCDFVVCAFNDIKEAKLVVQRIGPDIEHWKAVLLKVTNFWRTCVLPEVLGRWYTRKHNTPRLDHPLNNDVCYCRTGTDEDTVICCNAPSEVITFPAYKLSVCLRPGIVQTVELCQNSGKKENLLSLLGNQAHLSLTWSWIPFAYVKASLMKVTSLWNVTVRKCFENLRWL